MAYTQADLDSINTAIAGGKRRVRLNNREIEYFSAGDMLKVKADIVAELADAALVLAGTRRPSAYRARVCKGL